MGTRGYRGRLPRPVRRGYADAYRGPGAPRAGVMAENPPPATWERALPGGGAVSCDDRSPDGGPGVRRRPVRAGCSSGWPRSDGEPVAALVPRRGGEAHWPHAYAATPDVIVQTVLIRAHPGTGVLVPPSPWTPAAPYRPRAGPFRPMRRVQARRAARLPARDALPYSRSPRTLDRPALPDAPVRGGPAGRRRTGTTVRDLVRKGGGGHAPSEGVLRPRRSGGRALRSRGAALRGRAPRFNMRADASRGAVRHGFVLRHPDPPPGSQPVARTGRIGLRAATAVRW
jgi:hypothetical protein